MGARHTFTITELRSDSDPQHADDGARFDWTADSSPVTPFDGTKGGGARACPIKPWTISGAQRTVRTDYPGAQLPSEQVLGPSRRPFTLNGRWDDRYNGAGYALAEMSRFEAMCKRGNLCRFAYGPVVLEGLITEWAFDVQRLWDIDYSFTVSVHQKPNELQLTRSPETPTDPIKALDDFDLAVQAMLDADGVAPRSIVAGTLADEVTEALTNTTVARQRLADTIDARDSSSPERPVDAFTSIATQFRAGRAAAYDILVITSAVRADLNLATLTPIGVLDFEDWIRSLRWTARVAMGRGRAGDLASTERAEPNAVRLYRPRRGESLYAISRKFYGTPHAWRLIYDRNALATFELLGTETLIIPERGA